MQAAEILRKFADMIAGKESGGQDLEAEITPTEKGPHENNQPMLTQWSPQQGEPELVNTQSLASPLQQKLDILKQLVGQEGHSEETCDAEMGQPDELAIIKQNAGIKPVIAIAADDENPMF